ncbi:MAG: GNAT family N-acetyltransferase [Alphaproteobacteria bacterium]|nr:GNAT family N-acetyltransferase [Alphaproteobacteria bacterium]
MTEEAFSIATMSRAEVDAAVDRAAAEGWNPGLDDADCFYAADPNGFLVGHLDGQPVASISVVAYDDAYGFLGFYIVEEGYRGRGLGLRIWRAGMAYLGGRTVGLDGVVEQQANYRKSGFVLAHRNIRYEGRIDAAAPVEGVVDAADAPFEAILDYDRPFFPAPRRRFLECWLQPGKRAARVLMEDGRIAGYGVLRPCRRGHKVGPLFAETPEGAERLLHALAATIPGELLYLDPPEPNAQAIALAERHGMTPIFETARMYKGAAPDLPLDRIFGITTFELG